MAAAAIKLEQGDRFTYHATALTKVTEDLQIDDIDVTKPHVFAAVQFFKDESGEVTDVPTAGLWIYNLQTVNAEPYWEQPPAVFGQWDKLETVDWAANTMKVLVSVRSTIAPASLFWRLVVTTNET